MPANVANLSKLIELPVFTDKGSYCGEVNDASVNVDHLRISELRVRAHKDSYLAPLIGEKKGIRVPFRMVKAIGDIVLIKHIEAPSIQKEGPEGAEEEPEEES